jgi:hypothetical protein
MQLQASTKDDDCPIPLHAPPEYFRSLIGWLEGELEVCKANLIKIIDQCYERVDNMRPTK